MSFAFIVAYTSHRSLQRTGIHYGSAVVIFRLVRVIQLLSSFGVIADDGAVDMLSAVGDETGRWALFWGDGAMGN